MSIHAENVTTAMCVEKPIVINAQLGHSMPLIRMVRSQKAVTPHIWWYMKGIICPFARKLKMTNTFNCCRKVLLHDYSLIQLMISVVIHLKIAKYE
jgi:hypothetical protein